MAKIGNRTNVLIVNNGVLHCTPPRFFEKRGGAQFFGISTILFSNNRCTGIFLGFDIACLVYVVALLCFGFSDDKDDLKPTSIATLDSTPPQTHVSTTPATVFPLQSIVSTEPAMETINGEESQFLPAKGEQMLDTKEKVQEVVALTLSRFSPASAYHLATMTLAGANIDLKSQFEDALNSYHTSFVTYREKKEKETRGLGGIRITVDSEGGFQFQIGRENSSLDISDRPRMSVAAFPFAEVFPLALMEVSVLLGYTFLVVAGGFIAFLRYDVR